MNTVGWCFGKAQNAYYNLTGKLTKEEEERLREMQEQVAGFASLASKIEQLKQDDARQKKTNRQTPQIKSNFFQKIGFNGWIRCSLQRKT